VNDYSIITYLGAMSHPFRFAMTRTVVPADIDELNHVNNVVYLQWIQDVAKSHWQQVGQHRINEVVWVASRHEIDYLAPAFLGDPIDVGPWVRRKVHDSNDSSSFAMRRPKRKWSKPKRYGSCWMPKRSNRGACPKTWLIYFNRYG
jgi:hypothetical protein